MKKYVILGLTLLLLALQGGLVQEAADKMPDSFYFNKTTPLTAEAWLKEEQSLLAAPCVRQQTALHDQLVQLIYTTEQGEHLTGVLMKYGSFPWKKGQIVLSDRMAREIFLTDNILGASVTVEEKEYTVCGIYWWDDSLFGKLSQSIYEEVYLYLGDFEQQQIRLSEFFIGLSEGSSAADKLTEIGNTLGISLEYMELQNLQENKALLLQSCSLARLVLAGILLIWCCLRLWTCLPPVALKVARQQWDDFVPGEWVRPALLLVVLAVSVVLVRLCSFDLALPQGWLAFQGDLTEYLWQCMQKGNSEGAFWVFRRAELAATAANVLGILAVALGLYGVTSDLWREWRLSKED